MHLHHIHFFVKDAAVWRDRFVQMLNAQIVGMRTQDGTHTYQLQWGAIALCLSSPKSSLSPVSGYLHTRSEGVGAIGVRVPDVTAVLLRAEQFGGQAEEANGLWTVISPQGFRHTLVTKASTRLFPADAPQVDHVVLNVAAGQLEEAAQWYQRVFGLEPQQQFDIATEQSGLRSLVLRHPISGLTLPINEPTTPNSQIQEFLDTHGGAGIQHAAIRVPNLLEMVSQLRERGLSFLSVPADYYTAQRQQIELEATTWEALQAAQILLDRPPSGGLLLQIFSQPIFGQPTFFWELIERREDAEGFGQGNFRALFRAIEQEQARRRTQLATDAKYP